MPRDFYESVIGLPDANGKFTTFSGISVSVYARGTTTPVTVYQRETGVAQGPSPEAGATGGPNPFFTGPTGSIQFWVDAPQRVDIYIHDPTGPPRLGDRTIPWNALALDGIPEASLGQAILDMMVPIGGQMPYTGDVDPPGGRFLLCDGRLVNITDYPAFFARTGHKYNTIGGVPTDPGGGQMRIPDKRGRVSRGADNMNTARGAAGRLPSVAASLRVVGASGGVDTHTHTANIPSHTHSGNCPNHTHTTAMAGYDHYHGSQFSTGGHTHGVHVDGQTAGSNNNTAGGVGSGGYASCAYWNHIHGLSADGYTSDPGNIGVYGTTTWVSAWGGQPSATSGGPSATAWTTGGPSVTGFTTDASSLLDPYEIDNYIVRMK